VALGRKISDELNARRGATSSLWSSWFFPAAPDECRQEFQSNDGANALRDLSAGVMRATQTSPRATDRIER